MPRRNKKMRSKRRTNNQSSTNSMQIQQVPSTPAIRNTQRVRYVTTALLTGGNFTAATTVGYSFKQITSADWSTSSPWTQLSNLYLFVKPLSCRVIVTFNRATGNSDNPRLAFIPTPSGNQVCTTSMSLSTLESPTGRSFVGGPGQSIGGNFNPSVLLSVYGPITNGYMPTQPQTLSMTNLPTVYYGEIGLFTPGVNVVTVTGYVTVKMEFTFEFSILNPSNTQ